MRYTVVVPAYNAEETIERCLEALVAQEGLVLNEDYTIILVNDGSTDATVDIARRFPISIVNMRKNSGRIAARLAGAQAALTPVLLLVDARVALSRDAMAHIPEISDAECVIGLIKEPAKGELDWFNRCFYLIRDKYYAIDREENAVIDKANFKRAPKGTTCLAIKRDAFIEVNSRVASERISDDTLLLYEFVFGMDGVLKRINSVTGAYSQRSRAVDIISWLRYRGRMFADFYLRKNGFYRKYVYLFLFLVALLFGAIIFGHGLKILALLIVVFAAISVYLAEEYKDCLVIIAILPIISIVFMDGIIRFFWNLLQERSQHKDIG